MANKNRDGGHLGPATGQREGRKNVVKRYKVLTHEPEESVNGQPNQGAGGVMVAPQGRPGGGPGQGPLPPNTQAMTMNKAPSAIKTNIKSATQIHPYGR